MNADTLAPLAYVLAFTAAIVLFQAGARMFFRITDGSGRVKRRVALLSPGPSRAEISATLLRKARGARPEGPVLDRWLKALETLISQAGLSVSPTRLLATAGGVAVTLWVVAVVVAGANYGPSPAVAVISLAGAITLTALGLSSWLRSKRAARLRKIGEQLPRALDVINRGLRAGHPVLSAVSLAAGELGDPLGRELGLIVDATNYGSDFKDALRSLASRTGSSDVGFFAIAVGVQSETGGNLAEILESLSSVMRSRAMLGKKVSAMAGEGKATAWLLTALPIGLLTFQTIINPHFYSDKMNDPIFWPTAAVLLGLFVTGWVVMNRIINFKY